MKTRMKKWLDGIDKLVDKATKKVTDKVTEKAAEHARDRAVDAVKKGARSAVDQVEDFLFGKDDGDEDATKTHATETDTPPRKASEEGGALRRAREDADRRAAERAAAAKRERDAAAARFSEEKAKQSREVDEELAALKRRLGKK